MATGYLWVPAAAGWPPSDSPALAKKVDIGNYDWTLVEYANAADENFDYLLAIPGDWASGGTLRYYWRSPATTGNGRWQIGNLSFADAEATAGTLQTDVADKATDAVANNLNVDTQVLTTTGWAASELLHLRISRLGNHVNDTLENLAQLLGFFLEYTTI